MVALLLTLTESRTRKRSAENARKCLSHMFSTPNRLREFRRRRLVSVPGTRLKRLNSLFKQQILNFSTVPVIVRTTDHQTLHRDWNLEEVIPTPKKPQKLPIVL